MLIAINAMMQYKAIKGSAARFILNRFVFFVT